MIRYEGQGKPERPGYFRRSIAGAPYRNKVVRFRASVRVEPQKDVQLQLGVTVERSGRRAGFSEVGPRITSGGAWGTYEITGGVDEDAETVSVGFIVSGVGEAAIAGVSFDVIGNVEPWPVSERSRPLSAQGVANLTAFARLFGYVRHFHPSDQAARADWNAMAIEGIPIAESAPSPGELARRLEAFFQPVAPTVRVFLANATAPGAAEVAASGAAGTTRTSWKASSYYARERVVALASPGAALPRPYIADLGNGLKAAVPLELFTDAQGSLPHVPMPQRRWWSYSNADDRAVRLADVVILWNTLQHFYPYFDAVGTDWSGVLPAALGAAAADADGAQFRTTLRRMAAALHDGHAIVHPQLAEARLPISAAWIGGELIVTSAEDVDDRSVGRGDAIVAVDGRPIAEWRRDVEGLLSAATPQFFLAFSPAELIWGRAGERVVLDVEPFAAPRTRRRVTLERRKSASPVLRSADAVSGQEARPSPVAELRPGVLYVDLTRLKSLGEWRAVLPRAEAAATVILDMRGYPGFGDTDFLRNLLDSPFRSAQFRRPLVAEPDGKGATSTDGAWSMTPLEPYVRARKIFLTDGRAFSYAESIMGIVEFYKVGDIVGGPTGGTNGNAVNTALPGGYSVGWTGMLVVKQDGSPHHGVGILPTVPVSRTRAGAAAGRDEVLERALALADSPAGIKK